MWGNQTKANFTPRSAIKKTEDKNVEISEELIKMIWDIAFDGNPIGDPYQHLEAFEDTCDLFQSKGDEVKLRLFPFTLIEKAKDWFKRLTPRSITTWEELKSTFLLRSTMEARKLLDDLVAHHLDWSTDEEESQEETKTVVEPEVELPSDRAEEVVEEVVKPRERVPAPIPTRIPYPSRLKKEKKEAKYRMPNYVKFIKVLVSSKANLGTEGIAVLNAECSAILSDTPKKGDPGSFTIPCYFGKNVSCRAVADLGASINLMPSSFFQRLGLGDLKNTRMTIQLADRSIKYPVGIAEDVLVQVDKFVFPADFVQVCVTCLQVKIEYQRPYDKLQQLPIPVWTWEHVTMDFVTKLPRTPRRYDTI
ncbi:hypothetical protein OSB04_un000328 [Centaurea solstitialis]|uniref:Retrotransposon gag domain-containing protein n=1 Tax=Centaurea solstitialis TaxID=347529 RepID=A0AA38SIA4_9ASTR|nr:hypothetical protein OSB04_un000328 [Centaurea solstitialis]